MTQEHSLFEIIGREALKIDAFMKKDLSALEPKTDKLLLDVLKFGLFNGGKRIRPLLVIIAAKLCGKLDDNGYRLGTAFEYLHSATLFHDDIIDNSATRRGVPSVFKKFGTVAALLAGDFLHAHSMSLVGQIAGETGLSSFCQATTGMVEGEFMQLRNARKHNLSELDYYDTITGKTGQLIASACEIGAIYGGGQKKQVSALRNYGVNLGCAFQIVDDLLDYQGHSEKTGKRVGNDLAEGKMTLPLILALQESEPEDKRCLLDILGDDEKKEEQFTTAYEIIEKNSGFEKARRRAVESIEKALGELRIFSDSKNTKEVQLLNELAEYVLVREK